ncbi:MAG: hypothetical protein EOR30_33625 [Mesorhizobium sp.]|uniref:hypothetical protein n=1 Tax=Mesorhizobium sp. TaxID=1871066 RepID=UPI000FE50961|nr:hypothetical protein [Mesorhizobium sp.]RWI62443.1 MAG: hypothetical protein EOR17_33175 [Mesorhizobium sp.]RWJ40843.1 MAG: hypothetical protein EOR30_33625 [Mesorhizobium sp.]RWJ58162.1 MAG: hypothetical protein EOR32_26640 [Mesorhizobium sp.]RWJ93888.1 MAG: hypothetical protein EOR38_30305 [Mesorhizobium sp.]
MDSHLAEGGRSSDFECTINPDEPPDLIVNWKQGKPWGVEVTRAYQQVQQIGNKGISSSEEVSAYLRKFGGELRELTKQIRRRDCSLYLEIPGPFNSWKRSVPTKQWKEETQGRILRHISSGESSILRFPGGNLRPGAPGRRWFFMIGGPATELTSTITAMLSRSLTDKARRLEHWKERFEQCWLLILNCYPLADDSVEIESILRQIAPSDARLAGFDGVLWSGFPDRTLLRISLS